MSTVGKVVHYTEWDCQTLTPKKYTVLNDNSVFDLHIFQGCIPGVKWDLPVYLNTKTARITNKMK